MFVFILQQKVSNKWDFCCFFWPFFAVFNGEGERFSLPAFFPPRAPPIFARLTRTRNGDRSVIDLLLPTASGDTGNPPPDGGRFPFLQPLGRLTTERARTDRRAAEPPRGSPIGVHSLSSQLISWADSCNRLTSSISARALINPGTL